jgi:geranylgeranyl diphosphate synthase type II
LQNTPSDKLPQVFERFNTMAAEVCEGQQYDMDFEQQEKVSVTEYTKMIELKTAALLSGSVTIGARLAGASEEDINRLDRFATEVGIAFQLQDDLLDSFGDERLGKKIGGDILEGKKTYLMIMAMSHANEEQREVLRTTHLRSDLSDDEKIATIKALYESLNIRSLTEQQITLRINRALSILETVSVEPSRTEQMRRYVESLVGRNY